MSDAPLPGLAPMIGVPNAAEAIAFYEQAFGAKRVGPYLTLPEGGVVHAEIALGESLVMLAEHAVGGAASPKALGEATARFSLTVADVDAVWSTAVAAGAEIVLPLGDQFYGHRSGRLRDPFGHEWVLGQVLETLSPEEMQRRMDAMMGES
ncbi:MAG: VOC family protein [Pseudomonadota bacterium]